MEVALLTSRRPEHLESLEDLIIVVGMRSRGYPFRSFRMSSTWSSCDSCQFAILEGCCNGAILQTHTHIYMVPCPVFPPPHGMGGGMMPLWWCIYIHTYLHTYLPTYLRTYIHTITLPYLTLPYIPLHSIHTYIP